MSTSFSVLSSSLAFPKELIKWLSTLPDTERVKESMIAERNLLLIHKFLNKVNGSRKEN